MAITQAPFLSLGAKGAVAKTLVASTWKGIKTMRHYVMPANPRSTGQVAQRSLMSAVVAFWKTSATTEAIVTAWNKLALVSGKAQSGFNAFTSAQVKLALSIGQVEILTTPTSTAAGHLLMARVNKLVGSGTGNVAYQLYVGASENKLYERTAEIEPQGSNLMIVYTAAEGDAFMKVMGSNAAEEEYFDVSGIYAIPTVTP